MDIVRVQSHYIQNSTKQQHMNSRKALIEAVVEKLNSMRAGLGNRQSSFIIVGHKVERRIVYAGGSQWANRTWDSTDSGWAWVVDGLYTLTKPSLFGFDGRNMVYQKTGLYLSDSLDDDITPERGEGRLLDKIPTADLVVIASGIVEAEQRHNEEQMRLFAQCAELAAKLGTKKPDAETDSNESAE